MNYDPEVYYEYEGNGDNYYMDKAGELVSACDNCCNNPYKEDS